MAYNKVLVWAIWLGIDEYNDEDLSAEQIEALEELNHNRRLERKRASASKRLNENGGKAVTSTARKKLRKSNLSDQKYFCNICKVNCSNQSELNVHNATPKHKSNAAGIAKILKKPQDKALADRNVALKRFYCDPCDHTYPTNADLKKHLKTPKHASRLAKMIKPPPGV